MPDRLHNTGRGAYPITRPVSTHRFQRPQNYSILVGLARVCISPNRQRQPCTTFVIQADLANTQIIYIGDSQVSITNGLNLNAGWAWQFSVVGEQMVAGAAIPTPYVPGARISRGAEEIELFLDIADFFCIAAGAGQRLHVMLSTRTR